MVRGFVAASVLVAIVAAESSLPNQGSSITNPSEVVDHVLPAVDNTLDDSRELKERRHEKYVPQKYVQPVVKKVQPIEVKKQQPYHEKKVGRYLEAEDEVVHDVDGEDVEEDRELKKRHETYYPTTKKEQRVVYKQPVYKKEEIPSHKKGLRYLEAVNNEEETAEETDEERELKKRVYPVATKKEHPIVYKEVQTHYKQQPTFKKSGRYLAAEEGDVEVNEDEDANADDRDLKERRYAKEQPIVYRKEQPVYKKEQHPIVYKQPVVHKEQPVIYKKEHPVEHKKGGRYLVGEDNEAFEDTEDIDDERELKKHHNKFVPVQKEHRVYLAAPKKVTPIVTKKEVTPVYRKTQPVIKKEQPVTKKNNIVVRTIYSSKKDY